MPGFCTNCGAPLAGAFCTRCGQRAQAPATPPQAVPEQAAPPQAAPDQAAPTPPASAPEIAPTPNAGAPSAQGQPPAPSQPQSQPAQLASPRPPVQAAAPPAAKSSGAGKALLIIGGIVVVFCLAAFGAMIYGVHWMKSKVSTFTRGTVQVKQGNACSLLSRDEVQQVLGVTVEKSSEIMEGNEPGCAYYTNQAAFAELQKMAMEQARRDSEKASQDPDLKNSKNDNPLALLKHTEEMEGMVKGFGLQQPNPDGKVFSFTIDRNFGAEGWGTLRTTMSVVPGFKEVDGVGDHAMIGSFGHAFYVLKGDSMIHLDTMYVPEARRRGADLGRKLVSHL